MEGAKVEDEVSASRYGRKYKRPVRCTACEKCTHGAGAVALPVSADALSDQLAQVLKVSDQVATVAVAAVAQPAAVEVENGKQVPVDATVVVQQLEGLAESNANAEADANLDAPAAAGKNKKRNARRGRGKGDVAKRAPLASKGENGIENAVADKNAGVNPIPKAEKVVKKEQNTQKEHEGQKDQKENKENPQKDQKDQKELNEAKEQKEAKGKRGPNQNKAKDGKENVAVRQSGRRQRPLKEVQVIVK